MNSAEKDFDIENHWIYQYRVVYSLCRIYDKKRTKWSRYKVINFPKSHHFGMLFSEVLEESRVTVFRIRIGFSTDADPNPDLGF
jgi:hypothetical protein